MGPEDLPSTTPIDAGDKRISLNDERHTQDEWDLNSSWNFQFDSCTQFARRTPSIRGLSSWSQLPTFAVIQQCPAAHLLSLEMLPRTTHTLTHKVGSGHCARNH
jgi:hypothetical protein